jgi:hypothetical protein
MEFFSERFVVGDERPHSKASPLRLSTSCDETGDSCHTCGCGIPDGRLRYAPEGRLQRFDLLLDTGIADRVRPVVP